MFAPASIAQSAQPQRQHDRSPPIPNRRYVAAKRSAGVAPEVNLKEHATLVPLLVLESRGNVIRSPKQGYQWPHKKDLCRKIFLFKKKRVLNRFNYWSQVGITVAPGSIPTLNSFCSSLHKHLLSTLPTLYNCWKNRLKVIPQRDQFFRSWSSGYYFIIEHTGVNKDFVLTTCIDTFLT